MGPAWQEGSCEGGKVPVSGKPRNRGGEYNKWFAECTRQINLHRKGIMASMMRKEAASVQTKSSPSVLDKTAEQKSNRELFHARSVSSTLTLVFCYLCYCYLFLMYGNTFVIRIYILPCLRESCLLPLTI